MEKNDDDRFITEIDDSSFNMSSVSFDWIVVRIVRFGCTKTKNVLFLSFDWPILPRARGRILFVYHWMEGANQKTPNRSFGL
jgi:hypothetical protein